MAEKVIRKKKDLSKGIAYIFVTLVIYILLCSLVGGYIYYSFKSTAKSVNRYSVSIKYDDKTLHTIKVGDANNEYGLYVPFSILTDICSFGLAADGEDVTLFLIGTNNRIECKRNSSLIVINDNPIRISAPILYEKGDYLIPVVLLENYIVGLDVSYDDDKMVCNIVASVNKSSVALSMQLPDGMSKYDFPDSYKYYTMDKRENENQ